LLDVHIPNNLYREGCSMFVSHNVAMRNVARCAYIITL
jgi:hypothetical protein